MDAGGAGPWQPVAQSLGIVRQVVETHGGTVAAEPLVRGVRMRFTPPTVPE